MINMKIITIVKIVMKMILLKMKIITYVDNVDV
jgi:hypothetical protein